MKIKFLGGAEEVGRLAIKIEDGKNSFMVDYGVVPEKPPEYPMPYEKVQNIFITHAHLDHIGAVPVCYQKDTPILNATAMTASSMRPLLEDSVKIMNLEGYPARFNKDDISSLFSSINTVEYGKTVEIGDYTATPYSAGHIPGSSMWKFDNSSSTLVTGDLYTSDTNLLYGAKAVKADTLIMESTYAGKNHEPREEVTARLKSRIKEVVDNGGKVILPSFALGRTQELTMIVADLGLNVSVDGMGNLITGLYLDLPGFLRSRNAFRKSVGRVHQVRGRRMRESVLEHSDVVITTSGMLDGGPVLGYIQELASDPKSAIFLSGYQVEGTNGRSLLETGILNIAGAPVKPEMQIEFFDLSAHAGHDDLVKFVKEVDPSRVILCHGEDRPKLQEALDGYDVILPMNGHEFELKE
ncbi:MAG: MBL fold metallo-hydrolase [Candidatus Thermoplasmatota archaeon]|nr:MBL fold metallo-hydrolase [Candidatus Thermoplasmatota archaeon]